MALVDWSMDFSMVVCVLVLVLVPGVFLGLLTVNDWLENHFGNK